MRYLLLVSHGTMAVGVHSVIKMLLGERDNVLSHSMEDGVSVDDFMTQLHMTLASLCADDSVVVLGDLAGGSPLTNTLSVLTELGLLSRTIAFGGLNLPMAIGVLRAFDDGFDDASLVDRVISEAREGARRIELIHDDQKEDGL